MKKFNFYFDYFLTVSGKDYSINSGKSKDEKITPLPNAMPPEYYIATGRLGRFKFDVNDFYHGCWMNPATGKNMRLIEYFRECKNCYPSEVSLDYEVKSIHDDVAKNEYNWYVIEMTDIRAINSTNPLTNIPKKTIEFIKENDLKILMWIPFQDGFHSNATTFEPGIFNSKNPHFELEINIFRLFIIYEFLHENDMKFENLYLRHLTMNYFEIMNTFVDRYPQIKELSKMNIIPTDGCLWEYRFHLYKETYQGDFADNLQVGKIKNILQENREKYLTRNRNKWFLSLNRNIKFWRIYILSALKGKNILDKGYYSLVGLPGDYDIGVNGKKVFKENKRKWLIDVIENTKGEDQFLARNNLIPFATDIANATDIVKKMPILLDEHNTHSHDNLIPIDNIEDSYFSIISESGFQAINNKNVENFFYSLLVSEKTYKPLYYMHPFIVFGCPGTLKYLRSIGFKTFPEFFDESYDDIYDDKKRFNFNINEIEKVCKKELTEIHELYQSVIPKLIYNREKLLSHDFKKELQDWFTYEKQ